MKDTNLTILLNFDNSSTDCCTWIEPLDPISSANSEENKANPVALSYRTYVAEAVS